MKADKFEEFKKAIFEAFETYINVDTDAVRMRDAHADYAAYAARARATGAIVRASEGRCDKTPKESKK